MLSKHRSGRLSRAIQITLGIASGALAPFAIQAQTAPETSQELSEVIVTGFRASLEAALEVKKSEAGAVDAIVAEDIADFPDLNLAESIQRIPGVSLARDAGEGRQITVRGLGPEFTRVRLNGMEAMSANGGTDAASGTNRTRGFDFNTFASDLFNQITVRKTASAGVEEGSLGATVDLRTAQPFDYPGFTLVGSLTGAYNDLSEKVDPRAAFLVSNVFGDGVLGMLLSVAYTERNLVDEGASTVRWSAGNFGAPSGSYSAPYSTTQVNAAFAPRIPRYDHYEHEQKRTGVTFSLQIKPTDTTDIDFDVLYAKFDAKRTEIFLEVPNFSSARNGISYSDLDIRTTNDISSIVYGVFNNVDIRSENRYDELSTVFQQVTLKGAQRLTDDLKLSAMVGYSESDHRNPIQTTLLFDWNNIPQFTYDFRGDPRLPLMNYGSTDLLSTVNGTPQTGATSTVNSNGWYLSQIRLRPQSALNTFANYVTDIEWNFADDFKLSGGVQLKQFEFETTERRRSNGTTTNLEPTIPGATAAVPIALYGRPFTYNSSIGAPAGTNLSFLIPDINAAATALRIYDQSVFPMGIESALANNREVSEDDLGIYAQVDGSFDIADMILRGNLGVRYVETDQTSTGYTFVSGAPLKIVAERTYSDTLPSLNLALEVTSDFIVRAGVAKVMSRPGLGALTPGGTVNVSGSNRVANLGNPKTDPTRATAYDLGAEWYFAEGSILSMAVFRKDIKSRPLTVSVSDQVFTGNPFGIPDSVAVAACGATPSCSPSLAQWTFNTTVNGPGGRLQGIEVGYQQPFTFLPGWLSGFGAVLNYTGVDSEISYRRNRTNPVQLAESDLAGLSKHAVNATLYYETDKFSARVSGAYRGDYVDQIPGRDSNNLEGFESTMAIDMSIKYSINDHFDITLEGLNLTDEYQDQWVDQDARNLSYYHHTGRNFLLGVRAKL